MNPKEMKYLYCPRCDMTVGHVLEVDCYVCNGCGFANIILLDLPAKEDVITSSQPGFKVREKTAGGSWHYGDKLCLLCKRPAYPTAYYPPDFITTNNILVIPLCQHHKGAYMAHGLKRLDTMYLKDKLEEAEV